MVDFLDAARIVQTGRMEDECRIERVTQRFDRETGRDIESVEFVWEGVCRYPRSDSQTRVIVTGSTVTPATPTVLVPWDVVGVRADDRVTCTSSISPGMVGRVLWVTDSSPRTYQSAVHLVCREVR